jgi:hypothetical protein
MSGLICAYCGRELPKSEPRGESVVFYDSLGLKTCDESPLTDKSHQIMVYKPEIPR